MAAVLKYICLDQQTKTRLLYSTCQLPLRSHDQHLISFLPLLCLAGIYEQTFLIQLQPTNPGCEDSLLSGVCSLQVKKVQYSLAFLPPALLYMLCCILLFFVVCKVNIYYSKAKIKKQTNCLIERFKV